MQPGTATQFMTRGTGPPRRIGVLGGTFDPPHIGHVIVACEALWQLGLDEVRLVPARTPPHKDAIEIAPAERRAEWLERAVEGRPGLRVDRIELSREGPSYTADTMEAIAAAEPGALLWFLLGADQLAGFPTWRDRSASSPPPASPWWAGVRGRGPRPPRHSPSSPSASPLAGTTFWQCPSSAFRRP